MIDYPVRPPDWRFYWAWALIAPSLAALPPLYGWLLGWFIATNWGWTP